MPSPVGHLLGGLAAGQLILPDRPGRRAPGLTALALVGAASLLPDADFAWGRHNMETHSLGAAILAGLVVWGASRGREPRFALACGLAWASHVLFDWLGSDDAPPLGVMALWPLTSDFYFAHACVFDPILREYWRPDFTARILAAVVREVVLLGPLVLLLAWGRRRGIGAPRAPDPM
ncbi:MAG: metal-dependent hydrolase [Acidobacteriota bacterium]